MARFNRFEEIEAWQSARCLVRKIYSITNNDKCKTDFRFNDQIRSCSISIMANIAEGFERFSSKEFANFVNIAKSSCGELRSHMYVALDQEYINMPTFESIKEECEKISKMLWKLLIYLRKVK